MMKNIYSLGLLLIAPFAAQAQLLTLTDGDGQVVNGTVVTHIGSASDPLLTQGLTATINGGQTLNVNMRRYELEVVPGTFNYFCWGVCYDEVPAGNLPTWNAGQEGVISMAPGTPVNEFKAYLVPNGNAGTNAFRYVWYHTANGTDSVFVDIVFQVSPVGIEEALAPIASMEVFPNPVTGSEARIQIAFNKPVPQASLVVYNALGSVVSEQRMPNHANDVILNTSALEPGLYFAVVRAAGRDLATRRIVVAR
ncbi:MAG: T9SS type A sorting domain-containing protein [Flavobacteriales bacterium]|nr:T9SS type A sorting domain-containing protein [Flavobacteriales bacterium]